MLSAVASSPVLPTIWTDPPARAAASAMRDDIPAAEISPSRIRPTGDPITTITRRSLPVEDGIVSAGCGCGERGDHHGALAPSAAAAAPAAVVGASAVTVT